MSEEEVREEDSDGGEGEAFAVLRGDAMVRPGFDPTEGDQNPGGSGEGEEEAEGEAGVVVPETEGLREEVEGVEAVDGHEDDFDPLDFFGVLVGVIGALEGVERAGGELKALEGGLDLKGFAGEAVEGLGDLAGLDMNVVPEEGVAVELSVEAGDAGGGVGGFDGVVHGAIREAADGELLDECEEVGEEVLVVGGGELAGVGGGRGVDGVDNEMSGAVMTDGGELAVGQESDPAVGVALDDGGEVQGPGALEREELSAQVGTCCGMGLQEEGRGIAEGGVGDEAGAEEGGLELLEKRRDEGVGRDFEGGGVAIAGLEALGVGVGFVAVMEEVDGAGDEFEVEMAWADGGEPEREGGDTDPDVGEEEFDGGTVEGAVGGFGVGLGVDGDRLVGVTGNGEESAVAEGMPEGGLGGEIEAGGLGPEEESFEEGEEVIAVGFCDGGVEGPEVGEIFGGLLEGALEGEGEEEAEGSGLDSMVLRHILEVYSWRGRGKVG